MKYDKGQIIALTGGEVATVQRTYGRGEEPLLVQLDSGTICSIYRDQIAQKLPFLTTEEINSLRNKLGKDMHGQNFSTQIIIVITVRAALQTLQNKYTTL